MRAAAPTVMYEAPAAAHLKVPLTSATAATALTSLTSTTATTAGVAPTAALAATAATAATALTSTTAAVMTYAAPAASSAAAGLVEQILVAGAPVPVTVPQHEATTVHVSPAVAHEALSATAAAETVEMRRAATNFMIERLGKK